MRSGVKRMTALLGLTAVLLGLAYLTYPVMQGDIDCGSALMSGSPHTTPPTYAKHCVEPIHRQRWLGGAILVFGTVALLGVGPRWLIKWD